ncbi:peptide chain release factor N(5)-glutamine methyltransferase [Luteimonas deserti]|uniref:Release factor glutamine methyltransferase n=1 Tax=Luteimonas deserti TaxID=2752306 RepID=A0A7Z0TXS5_9GAMM|nr:peptide chain release factor N(5)-glutamine methyltransferase [Luteimonas deserti]NYZ61657.1 peptide chain release factor N(5)-glutamine methyltransferase [Luteimonas deserti]
MDTTHPTRLDAVLRAASMRIDPLDARWLLAHVCGRAQGWLYAHGDAVLSEAQTATFEALVSRRAAGEPVAYLIGSRAFWRLELAVSPATLIPRPETELLVEAALARLPPRRPARAADLGTGSGAIALAVAGERPDVSVVATDASEAALEIARRNAARHALDRVEFRFGDWYGPLAGLRFDMLLSNPPYIASGDPHLSRGDLRHEPPAALVSGPDGLDALRVLAAGASNHLHPGGWILVEHGFDQGPAVRALFAAQGLIQVDTLRDLEARDRVTLGRRPPAPGGA